MDAQQRAQGRQLDVQEMAEQIDLPWLKVEKKLRHFRNGSSKNFPGQTETVMANWPDRSWCLFKK